MADSIETKIVNWGTAGIGQTFKPTNTSLVYDLTNDGFTAKHTSSSAYYYRSMTIANDGSVVPKGSKIKKFAISVTYRMDKSSGEFRLTYRNAESKYIHKYSNSTSATNVVVEDEASLYYDSDTDKYYICFEYYFNSLTTTYMYISNASVTIYYEPPGSLIYSGDKNITSAYLGNTKLKGIYLGSKKLL